MDIPARIDLHVHFSMDTEHDGDIAPPVLALLQGGLAELSKVNAQLEILSAQFQQQGRKMSDIDDKVTALTASTARLDDTVESVKNFMDGLPAVIQAAVDAAAAKGATPEQLAAFDDLNARLTADADKIVNALVVPGSTPAPTP